MMALTRRRQLVVHTAASKVLEVDHGATQVFTLIAMEPPIRVSGSGSADYVRDAKVKRVTRMTLYVRFRLTSAITLIQQEAHLIA